MLRDLLRYEGWGVGRKHVATLMRRMGIEALYRKANTSRRHAAHPIYPYLLRGLTIDTPNQVWAMDTTYIPMRRGFVYLTVVLDWATRRVLAWRLSNSLGTDVAVAALEEALAKYGVPEIMNTDQGSQFTSGDFIGVLQRHSIRISMDGKGCWRDNVFVERLWKTIKYDVLPRVHCGYSLYSSLGRKCGWKSTMRLRWLGFGTGSSPGFVRQPAVSIGGAGEGTRTLTVSLPADFESGYGVVVDC
jgi:putative transposase